MGKLKIIKEKAITDCYANGASIEDICKEFKLSKHEVHRILNMDDDQELSKELEKILDSTINVGSMIWNDETYYSRSKVLESLLTLQHLIKSYDINAENLLNDPRQISMALNRSWDIQKQLASSVDILNKKVSAANDAFIWLLGYTDFPERQEGDGSYYWRSLLFNKLKDSGFDLSLPVSTIDENQIV